MMKDKTTIQMNIAPLYLGRVPSQKPKLKISAKPLSDSVREKIRPKSLDSSSSEPTSPVRLLRDIFARNGTVIPTASKEKFQRPAKEVVEAYDMETCRAIRSGDMVQIRRMHKEGKSLNGSNQFGESLLHMACRRGDKDVVRFMLNEARVDTNVRDDMGRTVVHDAFWTSKPNTEVMDMLLGSVSPELFLAADIRGHTPFDYARRTHWDVWCKYLEEREHLLLHRLAIMDSIAR